MHRRNFATCLLGTSFFVGASHLGILWGCRERSLPSQTLQTQEPPSRHAPPSFTPAVLGEIWHGMERSLPLGKGALHLESFGDSKWRLRTSHKAMLWLQGPFREAEAPPAWHERPVREWVHSPDHDFVVEIQLPEAGLWRAVWMPTEALPEGDVNPHDKPHTIDVTASCVAQCFRVSHALNQLVSGLYDRQDGRAALAARITETIAPLLGSDDLSRRALADLTRKLEAGTGRGESYDRILTFAPSTLSALFSVHAHKDRLVRSSPTEDKGSLRDKQSIRQAALRAASQEFPRGDFLAAMSLDDGAGYSPEPAWPELGLARGSWSRLSLTPRALAQSRRLAKALNALARNPSRHEFLLRSGDQNIGSVADLAQYLMTSGHVITLQSERMFAEFFNLVHRGTPVRISPWILTPLRLDRHALTVPMTHTHYTWRIEGPQINAKVMFYLGTGGVAFFEDTYASIDWWMHHAPQRISSRQDGGAAALKTLEVAAAYLRRNDDEAFVKGRRLPHDGYGIVGVCNDSHALIEQALTQNVTVYPLLRARRPWPPGELDLLFHALPTDVDMVTSIDMKSPSGQDLAKRILGVIPRSPSWRPEWGNLKKFFDDRLASEAATIVTQADRP